LGIHSWENSPSRIHRRGEESAGEEKEKGRPRKQRFFFISSFFSFLPSILCAILASAVNFFGVTMV
jgi:hypothetical protein